MILIRKGSHMHYNIPALKTLLLFLTMTAISLVTGCGGGGGSSTIAPLPVTDSSAKFQDSPLMSGKGQITQFAVSGDTMFWADDVSTGRGIWKYTRGDAAPKLLVSRLGLLSSMVVRGQYCYWIGGGVYRTARDGSDSTLINNDKGEMASCSNIADDKAFYFAVQNSDAVSYSIKRIPFDGTAPNYLCTTTHKIAALASDDNFIYWQENVEYSNPEQTRLRRISKAGGAAETICESIVSPIRESASMIVYANSVFLGTYGKLLKVPAAGGTPAVVAEGENIQPYSLVASPGAVYWLNPEDSAYGTTSLLSAPVAGGAVTKVVGALLSPSGLRGTTDGLYWMERVSSSSYGEVIKRLSWGSPVVETLTEEFFPSSFDVADGYLYCTEQDPVSFFAQVSRIPIAGGKREVLFGGTDSIASPVSLCPTTKYLLIGDGSSLKKVPISGGITTTLVTDRLFTRIEEIKERDGVIYFTTSGTRNGLYSIPLEGGPMVVLAEGGLYDKIVSVQDGYVYYNFPAGGSSREFRRVALTGNAPPETVYSFATGTGALAYDGIGSIFMERTGSNDQMDLILYDMGTRKSTVLYSGTTAQFKGFDDTSVFIMDVNRALYQIPRSGGRYTKLFDVPSSLWMSSLRRSQHGFYFYSSYLDPQKGYFYQVDALDPSN
jgi:hypothetical protein